MISFQEVWGNIKERIKREGSKSRNQSRYPAKHSVNKQRRF